MFGRLRAGIMVFAMPDLGGASEEGLQVAVPLEGGHKHSLRNTLMYSYTHNTQKELLLL